MAVAAFAAGLMMSASANAELVFVSFDPGAATPGTGFTVVDDFNSYSTVGITGSGFYIHAPGSDGDGAQPANSNPPNTPYLTVLGGGSATIAFADLPGVTPPVKAVQFDWGSVDSYNTLTIDYTYSLAGSSAVYTGSEVAPPANGNQSADATNGRFTIWGSSGVTFDSINLASSTNSFEIDNVAVGSVPEPATWAMMFLGFAGLGYAGFHRGRRTAISIA